MVNFNGRGILLDIEGTTSSIRFVYDVLFPFARRHLESFLASRWEDADVVDARARIELELGIPRDKRPLASDALRDEVIALMDGDAKTTGLKKLQGLIWRHGYESGELVSHVYPDVAPALERWRRAGLDMRIFSSGSVQAQKLFFAHTEHGNLLQYFSGHFDTGIGAKLERASYEAIADTWRLPMKEILFVSDVVAELDAARESGMETALSARDGNPPVDGGHGHEVISDFGEIECAE